MERPRLVLWLPVIMGAAIVLFLVGPGYPAGLLPGLLLLPLPCLLIAYARRPAPWRRGLGMALLFAAIGLIAIVLRMERLDTATLIQPTGWAEISGRIERAEPQTDSLRLTLTELRIDGRAELGEKGRARISIRRSQSAPELVAGTEVRLTARLLPPPGPAAPGAFDFQRLAWFQGLGAVGYAAGAPEILTGPQRPGWLDRLRGRITVRIRAVLPDDRGGIVAALVVGERRLVSEEAYSAIRDAGLAHLLAISGLHVGMIAGLLFFVLRFGLAMWERAALHWPIKKLAAAGALLGVAGYVALAGAPVSAERALIMTGFVLFAVVIDRRPISMRLVAWAAIGVLLIAPDAVLGPSFQMSFAAAMALVATYETARPVWQRDRIRAPFGPERLRRYLLAVIVTTLVAGLATAPFAAFHFQRLAGLGVVANLLAVPLTGIVIMPLALLALLCMPLGLEAVPLQLLGVAIGWLLEIAAAAAALPGAVLHIPALPGTALAAIAAGGIWICLWRSRLRWAGLAPVAAGILLALMARPPDLLVSEDAALVAVRQPTAGIAWISGDGGGDFLREQWQRLLGVDRLANWGKDPVSPATCDTTGCVIALGDRRVAFARRQAALEEDCARTDLVIASEPVRIRCIAPMGVIDRFDVWRNGAYAVWLEHLKGSPYLLSTRTARGAWPWVPRPELRAQ